MEKIKRALELAQKDRLAVNDRSSPQDGAAGIAADRHRLDTEALRSPDVPKAQEGQFQARRHHDVAGQYEFVRTKVVNVPAAQLERNRIVSPDPALEVSRAYDTLASRLLKKVDASGWNSIALVSPSVGEGKTVTAINLALHIVASYERSALLVDMDFRRPSVGDYFGLSADCGVDDVLLEGASVQDALISPGIPRFSVLPVRRTQRNTAGIIDSAGARALAAELKNRYVNRVVLFDLPPLLANGDAVRFLSNTDAALLVAAEGQTSRESLQHTLAALGDTQLVGTIMNRSSEATAGY